MVLIAQGMLTSYFNPLVGAIEIASSIIETRQQL